MEFINILYKRKIPELQIGNALISLLEHKKKEIALHNLFVNKSL